MTGWELVLVAVGGAVGAPARFVVDVAVGRWTGGRWPWGTLTVNVTGSAALGWVVAAAPGGEAAALLAVGLCGSFTTASAFAWEVLALVRSRRHRAAGAYVLASAVLGLGAYVLSGLLAAA